MGSAESELTTVPRKVYLSSFEFCGDSNETLSWSLSDEERTTFGKGGWEYGTASRLAVRSVKRRVLGSITSAFASFKRFRDSLQRL
jgi:hypothetical protein